MKELSITEKEAMGSYFNTYPMYCENDVIDRLKRLKKKLTDKNLMFKFDGNRYAIFSLDVEDRTRITDYTLTLGQLEDFAEKK